MTVAVNVVVVPAATVAVFGAMETLIPGTMTNPCADAAVFATEVAVRATSRSPAGGAVGAV